jgi:hypothetical protein
LAVEPKYSDETCSSATLSTTSPTCPDLRSNPGRRGGKPATNRLSYGTVLVANLLFAGRSCYVTKPYCGLPEVAVRKPKVLMAQHICIRDESLASYRAKHLRIHSFTLLKMNIHCEISNSYLPEAKAKRIKAADVRGLQR